MSTRDDLIEARALIDTPKKLGRRSAVEAIDDMALTIGPERAIAMLDAIAAVDSGRMRSAVGYARHSDTMTLFDRAIASQDTQP